ncbi:uncharacterized protein LOC133330494 [Musca vetustissima]|uniref:uncharacterized protein LOC133330494 n=1 Tax=Musca vetustissima TaxID=27455 RepID=UPI002AB6727E|nr:uncharacterized protein LOC133330494 [Musca vetustissima]
MNFLKDIILFRKYINGAWCDDDAKAFKTSVFTKDFRIYIVMADEKFRICINNSLEVSYTYRIRLNLLTHLEIDGGLKVVRQVDHRKYFPFVWPPIQAMEERLQFSGDVPLPFKAGHVMVIEAELSGNEKGSFIVHLRNVNDVELQELFGEEKKLQHFPFENFFQPFKLAVAFGQNELLLAKDGAVLFAFPYRTPDVLAVIGGLKIFGLDDLKIRIAELNHIQMTDVSCTGFENYSQLEIVNNSN